MKCTNYLSHLLNENRFETPNFAAVLLGGTYLFSIYTSVQSFLPRHVYTTRKL